MTHETHVMNALRRWMLVPLIAVGLLSIVATGGRGRSTSGTSSSDLFDDFSAAMIDRSKWDNLEFVRRNNSGVLESALTRFGSDASNSLDLLNPDTVSAIQADVTVTAVSNTNAEAQAGVIGDFYNDGTPGGGFIGDVFASTEIRHHGTELVIALFVARCDDGNCFTFTVLKFDDTAFGPVAVSETHTLSVAWDGALFTFDFDGVTTTFDPSAAPIPAPPVAAPREIFNQIGTRLSGIGGPDEGAFIAATFDNVRVTRSGAPLLPPPPGPVTLTWTLDNVTFADGGVATGTFDYVASRNSIVDWNVSVSGGDETTFPPFTYDPTTTEATALTEIMQCDA